MAFNFPASPTIGDTYTSGSVTYTWNGTVWTSNNAAYCLPTTGGTLTGDLAGTNAAFSGTVADGVGIIRPIVIGTSQVTTTGTSKDFTGIPSWVKRVTVVFNGVSLNGSSHSLVQLGAGSVTSSGYASLGAYAGSANSAGVASATNGFLIHGGSASNAVTGIMSIVLMGSNLWVSSHTGGINTTFGLSGGGSVTLGGTLDRLRFTTANGTDAFDAGSVNIIYE